MYKRDVKFLLHIVVAKETKGKYFYQMGRAEMSAGKCLSRNYHCLSKEMSGPT